MKHSILRAGLVLVMLVPAHTLRSDFGDLRLRAETGALQINHKQNSQLAALLGAELALGLNSRAQVHLRSALAYPFFNAEGGLGGSPQIFSAVGTDLSVDRIPGLEPWIFAELQGAYAPDPSARVSLEQTLQIGVALGVALDFAVHPSWRLGLIARYSLLQALQPSPLDDGSINQLSLGLRVGPAIPARGK